jgi:hypothetical protein
LSAQTEHGERIARLEEAYEHLATKADISELKVNIEGWRSELKTFRWFIALGIAATGILVQILDRWM